MKDIDFLKESIDSIIFSCSSTDDEGIKSAAISDTMQKLSDCGMLGNPLSKIDDTKGFKEWLTLGIKKGVTAIRGCGSSHQERYITRSNVQISELYEYLMTIFEKDNDMQNTLNVIFNKILEKNTPLTR